MDCTRTVKADGRSVAQNISDVLKPCTYNQGSNGELSGIRNRTNWTLQMKHITHRAANMLRSTRPSFSVPICAPPCSLKCSILVSKPYWTHAAHPPQPPSLAGEAPLLEFSSGDDEEYERRPRVEVRALVSQPQLSRSRF